MNVARLSVTPVKSLALHEVDEVELTERGVPDDRRFFLVDERDRIVNGVRCGRLVTARARWDGGVLAIDFPDGTHVAAEPELGEAVSVDWELGYRVSGRFVDGPFAEALSELAGRAVRLVRADDARAAWSEHPVSIIGTASIAPLREWPLEPQRFRMLVEVAGADARLEDGWLGRRVRVGGAVVVGRKPCTRCATTTYDPRTGVRDFDTLRTLVESRGDATLGIYCDVVSPGTVRVGDAVAPL